MRNFRLLKADEIECRVQKVSQKGVSLLLYKTARTDYQLFDETFGQMNWQNKYELINGSMYCGIGVYCKERGEWVWKYNCGTESNTEAEKGLASDALKRAGFAWGCGTELYSAPFIWISADKIEYGENNKPKSTFSVKSIEYDQAEKISSLVIEDNKGNVVFTYPKTASKPKQYEDFPDQCLCERCGKPLADYVFNGKKVTVSKHIGLSKTRYDGHIYCIDCCNEMKPQAS